MKILPGKKKDQDAFHFLAESVSLSRVTSSYNEAIGRKKGACDLSRAQNERKRIRDECWKTKNQPD